MKLCSKYNGGTWLKPQMPPAIFASTVNRAAFDLPWLYFAWFFPRRPHKLRTPPWSELHGELVAAGTLELAREIELELAMRSSSP